VDEGVIKFHLDWEKTDFLASHLIQPLTDCRTRLYERHLIGVLPEGVGFGNLSVRNPGAKKFIITGTQTGHIAVLEPCHYSEVSDFDIQKNEVTCSGPSKASSEALTHAMIYELSQDTNVVLHVHHDFFWKHLIESGFPATNKAVAYGTPQMAEEVARLFRKEKLEAKKIFAMAGHPGGVIAFGRTVPEAETALMTKFEAAVNKN